MSREVAGRLGLPHLDTGAFYRAATLAVLRGGVRPDDTDEVAAMVAGARIEQAAGVTYLDGDDVSRALRSAEVEAAVSVVSANPRVRADLAGRQRTWVEDRGGAAVVEGRDIGSVVFPEASLKIYLDARPEIRAQRRAGETGADTGAVTEELRRRDRYDSTREAAPLTVPSGAVLIDTSDMGLAEVVERIVGLVPAG